MEEYITIHKGITTYVCRKDKDGYLILAQRNKKKGYWVRYRHPYHWKWDGECVLKTPITKARVTAIFLMGRKETEI